LDFFSKSDAGISQFGPGKLKKAGRGLFYNILSVYFTINKICAYLVSICFTPIINSLARPRATG
jgi:hypothetical protein